MAKRSAFSSDEFGAKMCRAYDEYAEHHAAGRLDDDAPQAHEVFNQLIQGNRAGRAAQTEDEGGLGNVEIIKHSAQDNPPDFPGKPSNPALAKPAQDSAPGTWVRGLDHATRFVPRGGQMLFGDEPIEMPAAVPSTAASQRRMQKTLAGYDRLK